MLEIKKGICVDVMEQVKGLVLMGKVFSQYFLID